MRLFVCLMFFIGFFQSTAYAQVDAAAKFGLRESVLGISMSPDGKRISYLQPSGGRGTSLYVAEVDTGTSPKEILSSDAKPYKLSWCGWASNGRIVCKLYGVANDAGLLLPVTRMIAINADGSNLKSLGQRSNDRTIGRRQFDGEIVGWPSGDNGEVLMSRTYLPEVTIGTRLASSDEGLGVDRVDTSTLKSSHTEVAKPEATEYIADTAGNVRIMRSDAQTSDGTLKGITTFLYRTAASNRWREFSKVSDSAPGLEPVAVDASRNIAYAFGPKEGHRALFSVVLDETLAPRLLIERKGVDIDSVITLGRTGRVIGAEVVTDKREAVIFDPEYALLAARLSKALPGLPLVQLVGASRDESRLLLFAGSDKDPGRYYTYEKATRRLNEILLARPQLEGTNLATVKPITYLAADGTQIPAYLTLPPRGATTGLPALVMPHGGPAARDEWGFDWLAQFFANQGFAVLQPNFRGSSGYGDDWYAKNGFKSWRLAVGDVVDAGKYLVSSGIADKSKLAIMGWSYGGYAALQSGVTAPSLFKAIVAVAPVTDLAMLKQEAQQFTNSQIVADYIGSGEHVVSGSPLKRAGEIAAPVLMFSGDMDLNVAVGESRAMNAALLKSGKSGELVVFGGLAHSLDDSQARTQMLQKSLDFLKKNLLIE